MDANVTTPLVIWIHNAGLDDWVFGWRAMMIWLVFLVAWMILAWATTVEGKDNEHKQ